MEEIFNNYSLSDILLIGFFIGIIFNMIQDIIISLIDYLQEKAWRVKDYEKIIYEYLNTYDVYTDEEKEIIATARNNYNKKLKKRKKIDNFFNKFKKGKNNE